MKKTSSFQNSLIWFGAAVSIAEILTGTYFAPLGFTKGLLAILVGHVIGCAMFFFAGLIGGRTGRSAMETVKMSFGQKGGLLFALLNVLQLVGWTAIMIYDGALAIGGIFDIGRWVWCLVIGGLIIGMLTRTARGHTGRPLQPSRGEVVAYALVMLAAVLRVLVPAVQPAWYAYALEGAACLWAIAFAIYLVIYTPWLMRTRLDGKDG